MSEQSGFNVTIKKGQLVEVISYEKTRQFCGRESEYNKGDSFIVESVSDNPRGHGKILSDNNFNYVHEDDVKWVSVVTAGHRIDEPFDSHREKAESVIKNGAKLTDHEIDLEVVVKQPKNTPEPLVDMASSVGHKDAVREAFISKAKELGIYYGASETGEFFSTETRAGWEFWNARQAEVDEKQKRIDELEAALIKIKGNLNLGDCDACIENRATASDVVGWDEEKALGGGV